MKIGRNDPCPCGSGKKYKKCCLGKNTIPSQTLYYRRLSEAHDRLVDRLLPHATRTFGEEVVGTAMHEFLLWPESEEDISDEILDRVAPLFWPWLLFNWEYNPIEDEVVLSGPENRTIAELYAEEHTDKLNALERSLIEGINREPYSFWEVLSVDKGKGINLQDILRGSRIEVQERTGSQQVQPGDLIFGRAVSIDGVGMLIGLGPTLITPRNKPDIIQLRKRLHQNQSPITDETLTDWALEIRELYFDIDKLLNTMPKLSNTDGQPLEFHRLVYDVSSGEEALEKLCDLCDVMEPDELRSDAKRDDSGRIIRVEFPWVRRGDKASLIMSNTVLGNIVIDGNRLIAEVNSAERAEQLRHEIDVRLGDGCRFKMDEIRDMDAVMSERPAGLANKKISKEHEELMQHQEVQEHLAALISSHWESWVEESIPALGGKSPREAVKSEDGREAVEALLREAERDRGQDPIMAEANRESVKRVRSLLGLNNR